MRNLEKYVAEGKKKIEKNSRYDMQLSDYQTITEKMDKGLSLFEALEMVFNAGVEAGSRIEKKTAAEKCS